jgi:hypothetical protein
MIIMSIMIGNKYLSFIIAFVLVLYLDNCEMSGSVLHD